MNEYIQLQIEKLKLKVENKILRITIGYRKIHGYILRKEIKLIHGLSDEEIDKLI